MSGKFVFEVHGDWSGAKNLFVSKRTTGTGAEYTLFGPLARAVEAALRQAVEDPASIVDDWHLSPDPDRLREDRDERLRLAKEGGNA